LVIAGAGSGKTETIASRVLWLVVNGHVRPRHILGLTFTRKAAGELAERVRNRLLTFVARTEGRSVSPAQRTQLDELHRAMHDELDLPEVSTYNSFAAGLVQEFAPVVGAEARLIDESVAWNIAREVVLASTDARLPKLNLSVNTITER